ncbi:MAG TPA: hypothetical protein VHV09_22860 [Trebonia sp.]|jgi:hypothetical protein|nr:hypothetical protein [Trebonia sp.]
MADDLLFVYSAPGPVDVAEFTDWYDNEHVPARLAAPGFGAITRFRALDGLKPDWLATYEVKPGTLDTPEYKALWENATDREKRIMSSLSTLDRRLYSLLSDSWADGVGAASGPPPVVMAVSMSVPPAVEPDLAAYYEQEHYPLLLAVPGWRRARRYVLTSGTGPKYLSLHEIDSEAAFDEPGYKTATSTPWRNRIVGSALGREKRVFGLHKSFS